MKKETLVKNVVTMAEKLSKSNPELYVLVQQSPNGVGVLFAPRSEARAQWVEKVLTEMRENYPRSAVKLTDPERKVVVVEFRNWHKVCGTGVALCSLTDEFDTRVGIAVAYAKWVGDTVPDFV
jgi:hypothetical protein